MMIVFSYNKWSKVANFDHVTGCLSVYNRAELDLKETMPKGHFALLSDDYCVFFRHKGKLYLQVDRKKFALDGKTTVCWRSKDNVSLLEIFYCDELVKSLEYKPDQTKPIPGDPTSWEKEDSDFGLFITNVLADQERRQIIYND